MKTHVGENYMTDDGNELVIGGKLTVQDGATISGLVAEVYNLPTAAADTLGGVKVGDGLSIADGVLSVDMEPAANQAASTADTVTKLKNDFNTLLAALKTAGLMEADSEG